MHSAAQEHRLPEDLLGLVQRVREIQIGDEIVGKETSGEWFLFWRGIFCERLCARLIRIYEVNTYYTGL